MNLHNFISVISIRDNLNEQRSVDTKVKSNINFDFDDESPL